MCVSHFNCMGAINWVLVVLYVVGDASVPTLSLCRAACCLRDEESGVMEGVVVVLPESVSEERERSVTRSSFSTFSADWSLAANRGGRGERGRGGRGGGRGGGGGGEGRGRGEREGRGGRGGEGKRRGEGGGRVKGEGGEGEGEKEGKGERGRERGWESGREGKGVRGIVEKASTLCVCINKQHK